MQCLKSNHLGMKTKKWIVQQFQVLFEPGIGDGNFLQINSNDPVGCKPD